PDVSEASLEDPAQFASILRRYVALTRSPYPRRPSDIVVWPEGAIAAPLEDYLAPQTWTRTAVLESLTPGQTLLLGGYRWAGEGGEKAYNSLAVVRPPVAGGAASPIIGLYDKYRLVPFGEFIPLDGLAARLGIKQLVHVGGGFAAGPPPRPLRVAGLPPFQPLICYEALFPGFTRDGARRAGERPAFLVNVSTDAWFGPGAGPLQHFNLARYRSIEEGLPMLRATPTGVSAVVDAFGRVPRGAALGLGATGIIDAALPPALGPTLYDRLGDAPFAAMLILSLLAGGRPLWPRRP
ncbi:MAG: apolipoprotein N-acyltransferase, partial [Caulobacteraceae bacterium]